MITLWFPKNFFSLIQHDCRLCVIERIESDHLPLELHTNVEVMLGHTAEVDKMNVLTNLYGKLTMP